MTVTSGQQVAVARMLVTAAKQKELTLRVFGGVAIYSVCPSIGNNPGLQRQILDVDFMAPPGDWTMLEGILAANGLAAGTRTRDNWVFEKDGLVVELCRPDLWFANFTRRLALPPPALPITDLLLIKLSSKQFEERDMQDTTALLLDHRVGQGEAEQQIDGEHIGQICKQNWELFHTVYDNTVMLEKTIDRYIGPKEAQLVWQHIELLQSNMDRQSKSLGWMVNQLLRKPTQVPR